MNKVSGYVKFINEWVSNKKSTTFLIRRMVNKIQQKSKTKITNNQLTKIESKRTIEYTFNWIVDHIIFEKILNQYQSILIDQGILLSYIKQHPTESDVDDDFNFTNIIPSKNRHFILYVKDIFTMRIKPPKYVYHMSKDYYKDDILANGITPSSWEHGNWKSEPELNYPPSIFAVLDKSDWHEDNIWRIDTEGLNIKWWKDLNFYKSHMENSAIMTFDLIPIENIKLL